MSELKESFDKVADEYDRYRSGYDLNLISDIKSLSSLSKNSIVCEIGAGTGQASVGFAPNVSKLICVEPGFNLAERLRKNLSNYKSVEILNTTFEEAQLLTESFDLVFAAQSLHWVDSKLRYSKTFEILKPGGWLAAFWKRSIPTGNESKLAATKLFQEYLPDYNPLSPQQYEADVLIDLSEMVQSNLFSKCQLRRYTSPVVSDTRPAEEKAESIRTWSMVAALEKDKQDELISRLTEIHRTTPTEHSNNETTLVIGQKID